MALLLYGAGYWKDEKLAGLKSRGRARRNWIWRGNQKTVAREGSYPSYPYRPESQAARATTADQRGKLPGITLQARKASYSGYRTTTGQRGKLPGLPLQAREVSFPGYACRQERQATRAYPGGQRGKLPGLPLRPERQATQATPSGQRGKLSGLPLQARDPSYTGYHCMPERQATRSTPSGQRGKLPTELPLLAREAIFLGYP